MKKLRFSVERELQHQGICDASGAVVLDEQHFAVANDEDNILKIYRSDHSGRPVAGISGRDLNDYFDNNPKIKEVDIEAATQMDGIIYWMTSHGRNKDGQLEPERRQFFANKLSKDDGDPRFKQIGHSYTRLVEDMLRDERLQRYHLEAAEQLPPKAKGGLNIEGLAATPNNKALLIGFRNPIPDGKAILLPLTNPLELIKEKNAHAIFGNPIELDLNGLGIRSLEYWESQNRFIIVAGAYDGSDQFALYQWSGLENENPERIEVTGWPSDFRPESVLFYPHRDNQFQLLSDDGSIKRNAGTPCKDIKDKDHPLKYFRSLWIRIDEI
ncbi:DUF3616 domain-containing protein [Methylomicrobium sp. Wu6]|uniref:DUF3616 domain-containing protein n=1 Tax=Methylomicrobium sp. Wu6 TaxID=3107928 RepID=UPI002DD6A543|nr:DUF3616 domain-containing protein [Methylomicrobium sp. Wu6]MEC4749282.1 DUF3616 domain-containing protein [Methylomicrobium sp. Wu6]